MLVVNHVRVEHYVRNLYRPFAGLVFLVFPHQDIQTTGPTPGSFPNISVSPSLRRFEYSPYLALRTVISISRRYAFPNSESCHTVQSVTCQTCQMQNFHFGRSGFTILGRGHVYGNFEHADGTTCSTGTNLCYQSASALHVAWSLGCAPYLAMVQLVG